MTYQRIPDSEYQRLTGNFMKEVGRVLGVFNCHGLGDYLPPVTSAIVGLAEKYAMAVRGKEIDIKTAFRMERPTE
jgi:predicted glycoside hydrolase/deacetylase ChbG (UPF0249 family)